MEANRLDKVSKLLQRDLGEILQREAQGQLRGKLVTVTEVRITSDLDIAKVFLSIFPSEFGETIVKEIQEHTAHYRNLLGQRVRHQLRVVPKLQFILDESMDKLERIDELLNDK